MVKSRSYIATPPGVTIKEQLNNGSMSQKEFAARMDMSEKHISKLLNGDVQLTPDVAVKIMAGLTARGKDADKFWFSLFHELAHIVLGHVGQVNGTSDEDEKAADDWSGNTLIAEKEFYTFRQGNDYSEQGVRRFAKEQGIAPGIVVGRMQREGMIQYSMLNNLKEQYVIAV